MVEEQPRIISAYFVVESQTDAQKVRRALFQIGWQTVVDNTIPNIVHVICRKRQFNYESVPQKPFVFDVASNRKLQPLYSFFAVCFSINQLLLFVNSSYKTKYSLISLWTNIINQDSSLLVLVFRNNNIFLEGLHFRENLVLKTNINWRIFQRYRVRFDWFFVKEKVVQQ